MLGSLLLEEDRSIVCYEDTRHKKLIGFATVALIVWVIVLPIVQLTLFFINRKKITNLFNSGWLSLTPNDQRIEENKSASFMFSVCINGLRPNTFYWDQVTLLRNVSLCVIYVGFSSYFRSEQFITMLALIIYMLFALTAEVLIKPY